MSLTTLVLRRIGGKRLGNAQVQTPVLVGRLRVAGRHVGHDEKRGLDRARVCGVPCRPWLGEGRCVGLHVFLFLCKRFRCWGMNVVDFCVLGIREWGWKSRFSYNEMKDKLMHQCSVLISELLDAR